MEAPMLFSHCIHAGTWANVRNQQEAAILENGRL
jgi:hypothetical protein